MLESSLRVTEEQYGKRPITVNSINMVQNRQLMALKSNQIDVLWTLASDTREQEALAIKVPLIKGFFGYRLLLINSEKFLQFKGITSLEQLKLLTAVQGYNWPDVEILRSNGLNVATSDYRNAFKLLARNFVDYYPRAVTEISEELKMHEQYGLSIAPNIVLRYNSAFYFFVRKDDYALHDRIKLGLQKLHASGEFEQIFSEQPFLSEAVELLKERSIIDLSTGGREGES